MMRHLALLLATTLTACGGGSGSDPEPDPPPPPPPPAPVQLSISDAEVTEGDTGTTGLVFTLSLDIAAPTDIMVDASTVDGSALSGEDFAATTETLTIAQGTTTTEFVVEVSGDNIVEPDEAFQVDLSNPSSGADLADAVGVGTIRNDDATATPLGEGNPLNDTGIVGCADGAVANGTCDPNDIEYPGQDANAGRDNTDNDDTDGLAGFAFTKLDAGGNSLTDQSNDYFTTAWACVRDEVTGLVWETKSPTGGDLQASESKYSWFDLQNSQFNGTANGGRCDDIDCDTGSYVTAVNAAAVCGYSDWRIPSRSELLSIVNYGLANDAVFEANFFPFARTEHRYWSSSAGATPLHRQVISAANGSSTQLILRNVELQLRLVRGGAK